MRHQSKGYVSIMKGLQELPAEATRKWDCRHFAREVQAARSHTYYIRQRDDRGGSISAQTAQFGASRRIQRNSAQVGTIRRNQRMSAHSAQPVHPAHCQRNRRSRRFSSNQCIRHAQRMAMMWSLVPACAECPFTLTRFTLTGKWVCQPSACRRREDSSPTSPSSFRSISRW